MVDDANTSFGSVVTYSCNTGYRIEGNSTRICQVNGSWTGEEPSCEGRELITCALFLYLMQP